MEEQSQLKEQLFEVDGKMVTLQEFQEMSNDPKKKLKEVEPGKWKLLERLYG
jgi:hypothetical protein